MLGGRAGLARTASLATVAVLTVAACSSGSDTVDALDSSGWPAAHADARNSNSTEHSGLENATFDWSRPLGGPVVSPVSIASTGQMFVSTYTDAGCNLFSFEIDSGRKRWCNRSGPSVATATPLVDSVANTYIATAGGSRCGPHHGPG